MTQSLARWQAVALGLLVLAAGGLAVAGVARIAAKQGVWADTFEITVSLPEAHDVNPGTPVRVRGVDAGQVVAVVYPPDDSPAAAVTLRLRLDAKFVDRLHADATARVLPTGLLGSKVIAVSPGTPAAGPLASRHIVGTVPPDLADAAAKLRDTAAEAEQLIREVRTSTGTVSKLLKNDDLYRDLKELTADARGFTRDGQDTLRSIRANADAVQKMPLIRSYVEDAAGLLVRPAHRRDRMAYAAADLFEPGTAVLTDAGRAHLQAVVGWLKGVRNDDAEVVVAAFGDPTAADQTAASSLALTRKEADAVIEYLRAAGVHKLGWWTRRKMTPLGMGTAPSPVVEKDRLPASRVEILLFTPQ